VADSSLLAAAEDRSICRRGDSRAEEIPTEIHEILMNLSRNLQDPEMQKLFRCSTELAVTLGGWSVLYQPRSEVRLGHHRRCEQNMVGQHKGDFSRQSQSDG